MTDLVSQVNEWEDIADEEQRVADQMMQQVTGDAFTLKDLLDHVTRLRNKADELREKADAIDKVIDGICSHNLPDLFTKMKQEKVICDTFTATLKDIVSAYIEDAEQALPWLIENGAEDLVKTKIKLDLPRGSHENAISILKFAQSRGASGVAEENIHQATLTKWVKEEMENGRNFFPESIKIFQGRKVIFRKRPVRK
jgi:uncharacterized protein YicC (UPF0701 family)